MSGYVKIYGSILGSSVWAESPTTRIVWITLLALADQDGRVEASVSGLARFANVTIPECRDALAVLMAPDPDDRSGVEDGRRIRKHQGGWTIINYQKYREMRSPKQVADAERQKQWRDRQRDESQTSHDVAATVAVAVAVKASSSSSASARDELLALVPKPHAWQAEMRVWLDGMRGVIITPDQVEDACRDYLGNGATADPNLAQFRAYLRRAAKPASPIAGGGSDLDHQIASLEAWAKTQPDYQPPGPR